MHFFLKVNKLFSSCVCFETADEFSSRPDFLTSGGESGIICWHLFLFSLFDNFDERDKVRNSKAVFLT